MSQFDFGTIDPTTKSGTALAADLNADRDAMQSLHKGSTAPTYKKVGMCWLDDAANPLWIMKMWDGTDWIQLMVIDVVNNLCSADNDRVFTLLGPQITVTTAGTPNNYTASISPAPTSWVANTFLFVTWNVANTGSSVLNLNGIGNKTIKLPNGAVVAAGDLPLNGTSLLFYNGTDLILMSNSFWPTATRALDMANFPINRAAFTQAANISGSGAQTINYALGNWFQVTATGNITLSLSNLPSSLCCGMVLACVNFGGYTITWPTGIKWEDSLPPVMTTAGTDLIMIMRDASNNIYGVPLAFNVG